MDNPADGSKLTNVTEVVYALRYIQAGSPDGGQRPTVEGLSFAAWHGMYSEDAAGAHELTEKGVGFLGKFGFLNPALVGDGS